MKEKTIVKLLINKKVQGQAEFTDYQKALTYAKNKSYEGYTCMILRYSNEKEWVKLYLNPPETM